MAPVRALFVPEGPSDRPLSLHIEDLAFERGVEVRASPFEHWRIDHGPGLVGKLQAGLRLVPGCALVLIHRDADAAGYPARLDEIRRAVQQACPLLAHVPIVPVTMTEAWLLVDEKAIRSVAGRPRGTAPLGLPKPSAAEGVRDPKGLLRDVLARASEHSGRRLKDFHSDFGHHRRELIERIDRDGPVQLLPSWQRFVSDIGEALTTLP